MADPTGFLKYTHRELPQRRPVPLRLRDWNEVYEDFDDETLRHQASRCMDCGIPFCHNGCPLGNLIPEWNDLVRRDRWRDAIERLHATNNFPDFTGRLCPAPCEPACVLGINQDPVTIKQIELEADLVLLAMGFVGPERAGLLTDLDVKLTDRGNVARGADFDTSVPGVFVAGDMGRGQSLIVWAIAEGRAAAAGVDRYLMGSTALPAPINPTAAPLQ